MRSLDRPLGETSDDVSLEEEEDDEDRQDDDHRPGHQHRVGAGITLDVLERVRPTGRVIRESSVVMTSGQM